MTQVNLSDIITIQKGKKPNEIKPECFDGFFRMSIYKLLKLVK